ncbi:uncharacterized protein RJT21DRAFT_121133 [Scheffersomyces amazonensis]|uniref:uncharacterized protein n=1 Tax=Scheffersomyces amazonensis TaxID=1078765 RepID=UPI00315D81D8
MHTTKVITYVFLVAMAAAKNVVDLNAINAAFQNEAVHKRDAKNIVDLNEFKSAIEAEVEDAGFSKRDAKYSVDLTKLQDAVRHEVESYDKRGEDQFRFIIDEDDSKSNVLQSLLPQIQAISIMSGYIRDNEKLSIKTELTNETMIIVAPTNEAIAGKLSGLKPWEFPNPITDKMDDETVERILSQNIESFLNNHIVTNFEQNLSINKEDKLIETKLVNGDLLKIKQDETTQKFAVEVIHKHKNKSTGWIAVQSVKQVDNGFIFIVDDTLVKPKIAGNL